jgi:hypothetical protein
LIPPAKHGGRRREVNLREIVSGADVRAEHGLPVALRSKGLAAEEHAARLPRPLELEGTLGKIHHALYAQCREHMGPDVSSTACVIDSQSVKSAEKGEVHPPGQLDAGKKRHILVIR